MSAHKKSGSERRHRRSTNVAQALRHQLEACRQDAGLAAMVLSDESGLCVAAVGASQTCEEIAARLPLIGRKARDFQGILLGGERSWPIVAKAFRVDDAELYVCAVGKAEATATREVERSIGGVSRILAAS
jgi:hypothetical protein